MQPIGFNAARFAAPTNATAPAAGSQNTTPMLVAQNSQSGQSDQPLEGQVDLQQLIGMLATALMPLLEKLGVGQQSQSLGDFGSEGTSGGEEPSLGDFGTGEDTPDAGNDDSVSGTDSDESVSDGDCPCQSSPEAEGDEEVSETDREEDTSPADEPDASTGSDDTTVTDDTQPDATDGSGPETDVADDIDGQIGEDMPADEPSVDEPSADVQDDPSVDGPSADTPINVGVVEVGYYNNGVADTHAQDVRAVVENTAPDLEGEVEYIGVGLDEPTASDAEGEAPFSGQALANTGELDQLIDITSSGALDSISEIIDERVANVDTTNQRVLNFSLEGNRSLVYSSTLQSLGQSPEVARELGLSEDEITYLQNPDNPVNGISEESFDRVIAYVDSRMDAEGSAHQQALANYQESTLNGSENGVSIVVVAGNSGEVSQAQHFEDINPGVELNFLAMSDQVITVGASVADDEMAAFSSQGDGQYGPTIAATGTEIPTVAPTDEYPTTEGTSFSSPQVAGATALILERYPNLTPDQLKEILELSAAGDDLEGAGQLDIDAALALAAQTVGEGDERGRRAA